MSLPDWESITEQIVDFIKRQVKDAGADGVVFGLSGGIDSTVTAYLCKRAMNDRCIAMIMPNLEFTPDSETNDGLAVATRLAIRYKVVTINQIANLISTENTTDDSPADRPSRLKKALGNLNARIRAVILYYEAQKNNYLVVGTDDKSEYLIGYFTKYGDGACDMLPLADLYKTQVIELGRFLGIPQNIIEKPSSPHLWKEHKASEEIGVDYTTIEKILDAIESDRNIDRIAKELNIPLEMIRRIEALNRLSAHKRKPIPIAILTYDL